MPSVEPCPLPNLPPNALAWIRELDPEDEVVLLRRGAKLYEPFERFSASPSHDMVVRDVSRKIKTHVDTEGDGYYALQLGEESSKQFRWYAYKAEVDVSAIAPDLDPLTRHALTLLEYTSNSLIRFVGVLPTIAQAMFDTSKAAADSQSDVIKQLRESAAENAEVLIAGMSEDRKGEREKIAFELLQQHMDKGPKKDKTTVGLLAQLMVRIEPADLDVLSADPDGVELLDAKTPMGFRDVAIRLSKRFMSGELQLSPKATERLQKWLPTIIDLGKPAVVDADAK